MYHEHFSTNMNQVHNSGPIYHLLENNGHSNPGIFDEFLKLKCFKIDNFRCFKNDDKSTNFISIVSSADDFADYLVVIINIFRQTNNFYFLIYLTEYIVLAERV